MVVYKILTNYTLQLTYAYNINWKWNILGEITQTKSAWNDYDGILLQGERGGLQN